MVIDMGGCVLCCVMWLCDGLYFVDYIDIIVCVMLVSFVIDFDNGVWMLVVGMLLMEVDMCIDVFMCVVCGLLLMVVDV